jgi:hypothetical protein|tara:strand:+ start:8823 stop:9980 length:1158 start_codon:yes stop_codon:yes gene_type:complete
MPRLRILPSRRAKKSQPTQVASYATGGNLPSNPLNKFMSSDPPKTEWSGTYKADGTKETHDTLLPMPGGDGSGDLTQAQLKVKFQNQSTVGVSAGVITNYHKGNNSATLAAPIDNKWRMKGFHKQSGQEINEGNIRKEIDANAKRNGGNITKYLEGGGLESMDIKTTELDYEKKLAGGGREASEIPNDVTEEIDGAAGKTLPKGVNSLIDVGEAGGLAIIEGVSNDPKHGVNNSEEAAKGAVKGASTGLKVGMNPVLMAATGGLSAPIGAALGLTTGLIGGATGATKADEKYNKGFKEDYKITQGKEHQQLYAENGGLIPVEYGGGGQLPNDDGNLPGTFNEFHGNTHEQGGIQVGPNAEVETGEVRWEDYIFSDALSPSNSYTI